MEQPQDEPLHSRIELVSDGDGLAVIGYRGDVEQFLRLEGLWHLAQQFDLRRLRSLPGIAAGVAEATAEIAANSSHWLKLTPESAQLNKKYGLMESKIPGVAHAMIGKRGEVRNWLQVEQGPKSLATNPAVLSGAAGLMAQIAMRQAMSEITDYLAAIDEKLDTVAQKVDDIVRKDVIGAEMTVREVMTMRDAEGRVTDDTWNELQNVRGKIADAQGYALLQLEALATKLEGHKLVRGLAKSAQNAPGEVQQWLAFLARCFHVQDTYDLLRLDRAIDSEPDQVDAVRAGLRAARQQRLETVSQHTGHLLDRIDAVVGTANSRIFWNRTKSPEVVQSGNQVAAGVHDFHLLLGAPSDRRTWQARQLGTAAELGSQAIQKSKDTAPMIATGASIAAVYSAKKKH